jgi:signal transduction histidine kinase
MAGERVLVADDEYRIVQLCVQLLSEQGYRAQGVSSGREAIARLEADSFDLLVVDIRMPDVDGLMVLRRGLALDPNLTTVVITGFATMDRVIEALNSGARGLLLKPFSIEEFEAAIEAALAQRQQEQERLLLRAQLPILVISQTFLTEADVGELSGRLLEVVARQMDAAQAAFLLFDEGTDELYVAATVGSPDESLKGTRFDGAGPIVEQVLRAQQVLVWDANTGTSPWSPLQELAARSDVESWVLVPLSTGKKDVGILSLSRTSGAGPAIALTDSDLNLLSIMGRQIAIALENARMYAMEQRRRTELARALEQQRELDRLKNQFIQNVSHELRTPLAMILGYAELLASGDLGPVRGEQQGPLDIIVQRSYLLRDLIGNITAILENEIREPAKEPVFVPGMIRDAIKDFQVLADQVGLTLDSEVSTQVPTVLGDAEHLRRVVDNLIGNALKFTPAGGAICIRLFSAEGGVMLQVSDTGIGVAPEHQERIFERFYQVDGSTRRTHGGCGLGLALVKEIIERHGGAVQVTSELGRGCVFTVFLPAGSKLDREADCM